MDQTASTFIPRHELDQLIPGYRLDPEPLSTTGMSQVYLATDTRLHHRKVAVKIMADYLAAHPRYRQRFLREIQVMAGLEHPNIVYVVSASGERDRLLYLVMPRAKGDLRAELKNGPLDLAATVHTITQVAAALDYAHDRGVQHRDVKPGNILFGDDSHVYLCDFGVAKDRFSDDITVTGETIGTRRYTAPEVYGSGRAEEAAPDPAVHERTVPATPRERAGDVYSLGAVLYHCLTGHRPYDHLDDTAAEAAQRSGPPPPASRSRRDLPKALDEVAAKAMHPDPEARFGTCGELAEAMVRAVGLDGDRTALPVLRDILARLSSGPGDLTVAQPPPPESRPSRSPLSALTALVALLTLAGVLAYVAFDRDDGSNAAASGGGPTTDEESTGEAPEGEAPTGPYEPTPTVDPVTGDDSEVRYPVAGECLNDDPEDYVVVSCDSDEAVELVYRVVFNPHDPNPVQADHEDAAWEVCGPEGGQDYHYYWTDSANKDGDRPWDPETDRIYWIMCYKNL